MSCTWTLKMRENTMRILAVDTAAAVASVAVMENNVLLGEYSVNHKRTHSQKLMPMMDSLLKDLELKASDMDLFAVSGGPGSFTGLRIGMTTVKALAYAVNKPMVVVPTLDAIACNVVDRDCLICPIMDARNNQVFTSVYRWDNEKPVSITEYMGIAVSELADLLMDMNRPVIFAGDAVGLHGPFLADRLGERCRFAPAHQLLPRAASVAYAAFIKASAGEITDSFSAVPFYLRKSQAEREFEKKKSVLPESC